MQTTASQSSQAARPPLCIDCAHHFDAGLEFPRICTLPASTKLDAVTGGPWWRTCTSARQIGDAFCGPDGRAFTPFAAGSAQQTSTAASARPQSWLTSAKQTIGDWLAALRRPRHAQESQPHPNRQPAGAGAADYARPPAAQGSSSAAPTGQRQSTPPTTPTLPSPPPGVTVRKTYLVTGICPMPGSSRTITYRYPTARQAHKVARDFTGPSVAVVPVWGYMTHEGWVQTAAPAHVQGGAA